MLLLFNTILTKLSKNKRDILCKWISKLIEKDFFDRLLETIQNMISINLLQNMELEFELFIPESVKDLVQLMEIFFKINQYKNFVPLTDFVNEGISENVHPIHEIRSVDLRRKFPSLFCLSDYPYLLSCFFKSRLILYSNRISQKDETMKQFRQMDFMALMQGMRTG